MLFESIYQRFPGGSDQKLIKLLETLYSYTTTSLAETTDDSFELTLGVRQGGPESPVKIWINIVDYATLNLYDITDTFN